MPTWADIFDQPDAVSRLRQAYRADRLPHAMLFTGPVGVGKATTAAALATLFLCRRPVGDDPCGQCDSCVAMRAGSHPDYHVVYKELIRNYDSTGESKAIAMSVDVVRHEVLNKAATKPTDGVGKVFVIEQAELMTTAAQNSLLKTLEEPAGRTLIILITDQPAALMMTIHSRARTIAFGEMSHETVVAELIRRHKDPGDSRRAADLAGGSLGVAIKWMEDGVVDRADQLTDRLDQIFAGGSADDLPDWFKSAADEYAGRQEERDPLGSKPQANRNGLGLYLKLTSDHVRRSLRTENRPYQLERLCAVIDAVFEAERFVDANVNVGLVFQQLVGSIESALMTPQTISR